MVRESRRTAIINGRLCATGDTIDGFHVKTIESDYVRLTCDGETVFLQLQQVGARPGAKRN
jgi:hypothetical protein